MTSGGVVTCAVSLASISDSEEDHLMLEKRNINLNTGPDAPRRSRRSLRAQLLNGTSLAGKYLAATMLATAPLAGAHADGPVLDGVVAGDVVITRPTGTDTVIDQGSDKAIINWTDFSIGENESVTFNQPTVNSLVLNRVTGDYSSQILGTLTANGRVFLVNPHGILFGQNARLDVGGLVASTSDIADSDFMAGHYDFAATGPGGSIVNNGSITAREGGLVAFVAPSVVNNGLISARMGQVSLTSGSRFAVDLYGDQLIQLAVDDATNETLVANAGTIMADGGTVVMEAGTAKTLVDSVVNMSGVIEAHSVSEQGGRIVLSGGTVLASGTMDASQSGSTGDGGSIVMTADDRLTFSGVADASAGNAGGDGGFVETSATRLRVESTATVDTSAMNGAFGLWSLDPESLSVVESATGDNEIEASLIESTLASSNVELAASDTININTAIDTSSQSSATTLSLVDEDTDGNLTINLYADISLGSNQTLTGEGSMVNVADGTIDINTGLDVAATGGTVTLGDGTYDLGTRQLVIDRQVNLAGVAEAAVIIDASGVTSGGAGVIVYSDGVSLSNLTILGPSNTYGLKLRPLVDDENLTLSLSNITVSGSGRTEIDLLGVNGATLTNISALGNDTAGVGISITDSHNVTLEDITTSGNQWGGIGIYSAGRYADGGTSNISLTGTNSIGEENAIYAENDVASDGSYYTITDLYLEGFEYTVQNATSRDDGAEYTYFQSSLDNAIAFALALSTPEDSVVRHNENGASYVDNDGDTNVDALGDLYVAQTDSASMSVQTAIEAANEGDTIYIAPGTYEELTTYGSTSLGLFIDTSLTLQGVDADWNKITDWSDVQATIISGAESNWGTNFYVTAAGVSVLGLGFEAAAGSNDTESPSNAVNKAFEVTSDGFTIENSVIAAADGYNFDGKTSTSLYFGDDGADDLSSFTVNNNRLHGGITVTNGAGDSGDVDFVITNNTVTGSHFLRVRGIVDGVGWLNAAAHMPTTMTGNDVSGVSDFIIQYWGENAGDAPDAAFVSAFLANNTVGTNVYATTSAGGLRYADYEEYGGTSQAFFLEKNSITDVLGTTSAGDTVHVGDGTYDLGTSQLVIDETDVSIVGESESAVIIDASGVTSGGAGVIVYGDGVHLENMTILGPSNTYGLKLRPLVDDENLTLSLSNITVSGSGRTEIDLLG
ncbi:MAG: filamentous hemagglutinin N-terminal domain-containing protein, partial [Alphaproteobacteria bacterium]